MCCPAANLLQIASFSLRRRSKLGRIEDLFNNPEVRDRLLRREIIDQPNDGVHLLQGPDQVREPAREDQPGVPEEQPGRGHHPLQLQDQRRPVPGPPPHPQLRRQDEQGRRRRRPAPRRRRPRSRRSTCLTFSPGWRKRTPPKEPMSEATIGKQAAANLVAPVRIGWRGREGRQLPHAGGVRRPGFAVCLAGESGACNSTSSA
ncbi:hypothetical protein ZWY2020_048767 [Hordeum vulgare]|nr:hypothetical protein ZWY2020_048767 [Hordeum vulgare]